MLKLSEIPSSFLRATQVFTVCAVLFAIQFSPYSAQAHPLEYHLEPLENQSIERVLNSFEILSDKLRVADLLGSGQLSGDAMGVTAIVWSMESAVAAMDGTRAVDSPTLQKALLTAGYEPSPYIVAEWKMEAERVWETYEVLSLNLTTEAIGRQMAALAEKTSELTDQQLAVREAVLLRRMSMLQTTAKDLSIVAPYRQRFDNLSQAATQ